MVKTLTYLMFTMFAMTTDSVGLIIPEVLRTFRLSLTAAGTFQYATMAGIAVAALLFGQLADRLGRRPTIIVGLVLFAAACFLMATGERFLVFAILLGLSGVAIGVFKTGALALIGDAILTRLLKNGLPWQRLYLIAAVMCTGLIVLAALVKYPDSPAPADGQPRRGTGRALRSPYVLAFSAGAFLYVGVEAAVYVWVPTWFASYTGRATTVAAYSISIFFLLRAAGRFLGAWLLGRVRWQAALALFSGGILTCFVLSIAGGVEWAVYLLPLSGLFMSVIYPTLNSKGISCLPKSEHGAGAGVILFFTCASAVMAPLAIGAVGDAFGHIIYGFWLATGFAVVLFAGATLNWFVNPTHRVLEQLELSEYVSRRAEGSVLLSTLKRYIATTATTTTTTTASRDTPTPSRPMPTAGT